MDICLITGSAGLIGSEAVRFFSKKGFHIIGIDNDMRSQLFGDNASTKWQLNKLKSEINNYQHYDIDIRDNSSLNAIFSKYSSDIKLIIHTAAQPSHDWAIKNPHKDFSINATGTLNLLEMTRLYCSNAVFIFTSTNKVYGDTPNYLPLIELEKRYEINNTHIYNNGIDENMSIDQTKHSLFGASKVAADILVQEYGKYFGMKTIIFRGGCLTGGNHSGTQLHGFLSYLMKCAITKNEYIVFGYKGKQVRDNIHSYDLINMFWHVYLNPPIPGEIYNTGGSRHSNCSMLEGIELCEEITGNKMNFKIINDNRIGDHIWYISNVDKFKNKYQDWNYEYNLKDILIDIFNKQK
jgi:CDP-paratose 2-epimerase